MLILLEVIEPQLKVRVRVHHVDHDSFPIVRFPFPASVVDFSFIRSNYFQSEIELLKLRVHRRSLVFPGVVVEKRHRWE